ncbi:hypothetical protein DVK85_01480 [Flavobacterium arcticum]|uniref:Uncharacterized protein n=1 Tax=Flavobacterium arcticum TaxID=1784713 RepID=A0A345H8R3_9FLAO|nr:hypothetical protein [Flavobacterium arcticum]AXG72973.1 hypothetical protein DVK85_01480 [Flavobacterium arcticum]KAF2510363.1 hypothetical protein E0W72_07725 [Flavobacterium arcticum]
MEDGKSLSERHVKERISLYSRMGNERQYFDIQKLQKSYENRQQATQHNRTQGDLYYAQGVRTGLPHASYETIAYQREQEDHDNRSKLLAQAKAVYNRGHNLSRWLNKEAINTNVSIAPVTPTRQLHKANRLSPYFNAPVTIKRDFNKDIQKDIPR